MPSGITTSLSAVPANALTPIDFSSFGKVAFFSDAQPLKVISSIIVILSGRAISNKFLQSSKAPHSIYEIVSGRSTRSKALFPLNRSTPKPVIFIPRNSSATSMLLSGISALTSAASFPRTAYVIYDANALSCTANIAGIIIAPINAFFIISDTPFHIL